MAAIPSAKDANVLDGGYPPVRERWHLSIQGTCVRAQCIRSYSQSKPPKRRGKITSLSGNSRMRMLRFINRIDWPKVGFCNFITLTYPDEIDHRDYHRRTQDRYVFLRNLENKIQSLFAVIWRIEWKKRKTGSRVDTLMPHIHMLTIGVPGIRRDDVRKGWRNAIGRQHGPLATDIQWLDDGGAAARYLGKYVSKSEALDIPSYLNSGIQFGRHWGLNRVNMIPMAEVAYQDTPEDKIMRRVKEVAADRLKGYDVDLSGGFTLFGQDVVDRVTLALQRNEFCTAGDESLLMRRSRWLQGELVLTEL